MDDHFKEELPNFFLIFGAEHSLNETDMELLERALHEIEPQSMEEVQKMCSFIVKKDILDLPKEELIVMLKKAFR